MSMIGVITGIILLAGIAYLIYMARRIRNLPEVPQSAKVLNLGTKDFDKHVSSGITLVDFWAAWCTPCKMMAPVLNEVAEEVVGKAKIAKLNIEEHQQIASRYQVRNIPTMLIFRNGKLVDRIVGVKSKDFLVRKLEWVKNK